MKQFLKIVLAVIVGSLIVSVLSTILFFGVIGVIAGSSEKTVTLKSHSVYQLQLDGELTDRSSDNPMNAALAKALSGSDYQTLGLDQVLANIEKAKTDDKITGIYLKGGSLSGGFASIKEIRDALLDFKTSGKFIVAYADDYTQKNYYLASVADKIIVNPLGSVDFKGIASETMFFKDLLEKIGVEIQVVKVGTYKSAVEPYLNSEMSQANREQVNRYISSIWNNLINEISESRSISTENLNLYADEMMTFQPTEKAMEYALIDTILYEDEVDSIIKTFDADYNIIKHSNLTKVQSTKKYNTSKLAVLYAVGGIDMGGSGDDNIVSKDLVKTINKIADDDAIKAVVFRVNSPGGSAYGSEQIWRAISKLKEKKPVVVSMGDYAASGGYYISCNADVIVAQPNTLTGSIGIFGTIPNTAGLYKKIGLATDGAKTNKMSDAITTSRAFTPDERNLLQNYVNRGYETFVKRCADGRGKTTDEIKAIAEGRVWTGEDALKIGLVDALGGIDEAVALAAEKAEITDYQIAEYPAVGNFFTQLINELNDNAENRMLKSQLGEYYNVVKELKVLQNTNGIQARMPYEIIIK
ncbi:MAG: signal peptide peptidase SppA [Paludibacter sp.]|jgi:protease-4|nr:signal peptide peptidase SppA [Paludibacter sp.]